MPGAALPEAASPVDGKTATALRSSYSGSHWLCTQNPAQSPHKNTDALWRARRGALGEQVRLQGQVLAALSVLMDSWA
jgi:hypothetical protein